jgi:hypothetical protein
VIEQVLDGQCLVLVPFCGLEKIETGDAAQDRNTRRTDMTTRNAKIIELAALMRKLGRIEEFKTDEDERLCGQYQAALSQLESVDIANAVMVSKLLDGKPYSVTSDDPEHIRRATELAQEIGATIDDSADDTFLGSQPGMTSVTFFPPSHPVQAWHPRATPASATKPEV